jgi:hypothetical protein
MAGALENPGVKSVGNDRWRQLLAFGKLPTVSVSKCALEGRAGQSSIAT